DSIHRWRKQGRSYSPRLLGGRIQRIARTLVRAFLYAQKSSAQPGLRDEIKFRRAAKHSTDRAYRTRGAVASCAPPFVRTSTIYRQRRRRCQISPLPASRFCLSCSWDAAAQARIRGGQACLIRPPPSLLFGSTSPFWTLPLV